ncbi:MAG: hypothetical protein QXV83_03565 [Candidatus Anstonellaceae archaeon]
MAIKIKIVGEIQKAENQNSFQLTKKIEAEENPFKKTPPLVAKKSSISKFLLLNLYNLKFDIEKVLIEGYINKDFNLTEGVDKKFLLSYLYEKMDSSNYFNTSLEPLKKSTFEYKHCGFSKLLAEFLSSQEGRNFLLSLRHFVLSKPTIKRLREIKLPMGRKSLESLDNSIFLVPKRAEVISNSYSFVFREGEKHKLSFNFEISFFSSGKHKKISLLSAEGEKNIYSFREGGYTNNKVLIREEKFGWQAFRISPRFVDGILHLDIFELQIHFPTS